MQTVLRVFQVFLALGLIGVVLLQRSEGGGLGIGSSGGAGSFMSVRGTANFLTRVTAILAGLFMITCLALAIIAKPGTGPRSIFDVPAPAGQATPVAPSAPVAPSTTNEIPAPAPKAPEPASPPASSQLAPSPAPAPVIAPMPAAPVPAAPAAIAPIPVPAPPAAAPPVQAPAPEAAKPAATTKPKHKKATHPETAPAAGQ
jgi:preprotein translocase subunit SecG